MFSNTKPPKKKVPCLPLSMMLIAFHVSLFLSTKGHAGSEKVSQTLFRTFTFQMHQFGIKIIKNSITGWLHKQYPYQKQLAGKQDFKGQSLYFIHIISFDKKSQYHPPQKEILA